MNCSLLADLNTVLMGTRRLAFDERCTYCTEDKTTSSVALLDTLLHGTVVADHDPRQVDLH